jgi:hypothetical protein
MLPSKAVRTCPHNVILQQSLPNTNTAYCRHSSEEVAKSANHLPIFPQAADCFIEFKHHIWMHKGNNHMPVLKNYREFAGCHWETGTIRNALAYQGVKSPHTEQPISEALLLGISGGITFGYFTFEYAGYLPHLVLLTRNTFNPMETLLERLAIPQEIYRTDNAQKGETNLLEVLEGGKPALVWADMFTLPYNDMLFDEKNWAMVPILVYGQDKGTAYIADRSGSALKVPSDVLQKARARVKKDEFRVVTLDAPDWNRLSAAVSQGIWQCVSLYMEMPPKGKRDNFGLAALQHWANMLTNTRNKQSWARYFERGERLWMALVGDGVQPSAYSFIKHEKGNAAERGMYAEFLDEAAAILRKPALKDVANQFRHVETVWNALAEMMLPDDVPMLKEAKTLLNRKQALFMEQGSDGLSAIQEVNSRLRAMQKDAAANFPLSDTELAAFRQKLSEQVMKIHDLEKEAVKCLQDAMA